MASIATENIKLGEEKRAQEARETQIRLSGEQEEHRRRNAKNILDQLRIVLVEGEVPGTEALSDACLKAEQLLLEEAQSPSIDPETRKLLEDIAQLAGSTKQVARHNDLGDRLNRIAEETKKALAAAGKTHPVSASAAAAGSAAATKQAIDMVQNWRPLFMLLARSKDFRVFIVDSLRIAKRVFGRHTGGLGQTVEQKFVEGQKVTDIARDAKDTVKEKSQDYSGDYQVNISDEEWNQVSDDFFRVLQQLSSQPQFNEGVQWLFKLLDLARDQFRLDSSGKAAVTEVHAQRAKTEAEELIASIAGRETFYRWLDSLKSMITKVDRDESAKQFLQEFRDFILQTRNAQEMSKEEFKEKARALLNKGREVIYTYKYSQEIDDFIDRSNELMENLRNEETFSVLRHHAGIVASDLSFVDQSGTVQVNMDMIGKLRDVIVPVLAETLKYIPLPRIEDNTSSRHYWVDSIVLCGYDVIPENVRFQLMSDSQLNLREGATQSSDTRLEITLAKIRTELKNVEFYYHRKSFPELTEQGRCTVRLGGAGATLKLVFQVEQKAGEEVPRLTQGYADFHISKMDIEFDKKSLHHDVLVPLMTNMWNLQIQAKIEKAVEENLDKVIQGLSDRLMGAMKNVNKPFMTGMNQIKDVVGQQAFATAYQNRMEKLE